MISLLLSLFLSFASDSCNNKDIILILGYNYNIILIKITAFIIMITVNFWLPLILHLTPRHYPNTLEYRGIIEQNICKIHTLLLLHCDVKIISKCVIEI